MVSSGGVSDGGVCVRRWRRGWKKERVGIVVKRASGAWTGRSIDNRIPLELWLNKGNFYEIVN